MGILAVGTLMGKIRTVKRKGIRLASDGTAFYVQRLDSPEMLSPKLATVWDVRGWLVCRGYTPQQAAFFLCETVGPMPANLVT